MNYEFWPLVSTLFVGGGAAAAGWKVYGIAQETIGTALSQLGNKLSTPR